MERIAIIGAGFTGARHSTPEVSYKELMFEAATKAYEDAGINPRKDVGSFIGVSEDFWEGTSIFDEYLPDQIGGAMRPVCSMCQDGLHAIATGMMHIRSGVADIVAIEGHSKVSDVKNPDSIMHFGLDPVLDRTLGFNAHVFAGLEMHGYLFEAGSDRMDCANVVVKNRRNALSNPGAAYGAKMTLEDVINSPPAYAPLSGADISNIVDGACVLVLASEKAARNSKHPVWINGIGWCNDSPNAGMREWCIPRYVTLAARQAYERAGIRDPVTEMDFAEIDDTYSYKELQHIEALGLADFGQAAALLEEGMFDRDGDLPVNVSGGSLGMGNLVEGNGLLKTYESVLQLRGTAGERQIRNPENALLQTWRGVPTTSGAVMVLGNEARGGA